MARDGLLPPFFSDVNNHTQVPVKSTILTGICAAALAFCVDVSELAGMVRLVSELFILICGTKSNLLQFFFIIKHKIFFFFCQIEKRKNTTYNKNSVSFGLKVEFEPELFLYLFALFFFLFIGQCWHASFIHLRCNFCIDATVPPSI